MDISNNVYKLNYKNNSTHSQFYKTLLPKAQHLIENTADSFNIMPKDVDTIDDMLAVKEEKLSTREFQLKLIYFVAMNHWAWYCPESDSWQLLPGGIYGSCYLVKIIGIFYQVKLTDSCYLVRIISSRYLEESLAAVIW